MTKRLSPRKNKIPDAGIESIIKDLQSGPKEGYSLPHPFHNLFPEHIPPSPLDPDGTIGEKRGMDFFLVERIIHALAFLREVGTEPKIRERKKDLLPAQEQLAWVSRFRLNVEEDKHTVVQLRFMEGEIDFLAERARAFEDALHADGVRYDPARRVGVFLKKKKAGAPHKAVNAIIIFLYRNLREKFDRGPDVVLYREIKDRLAALLDLPDADEAMIADVIRNYTARKLLNL